MVFMTMGDHKSFDFLDIILQISNIRNDQVDSEHILLRERKSTVYNNNTVLILKSCDVHSDLFQTSEWNDTHFSIVFSLQNYTSTCLPYYFSASFLALLALSVEL